MDTATMTMPGELAEEIKNVFCLGGGELAEERWTRFAYWYEGTPESEVEPDLEGLWSFRTVIADEMFGQIETPEGWQRVAAYRSSGEAECWNCGPGTDWDGSEAQDLAKPDSATGYRGDPKCPLCEGGGHVYLGDGWFEIVFAQRCDDE